MDARRDGAAFHGTSNSAAAAATTATHRHQQQLQQQQQARTSSATGHGAPRASGVGGATAAVSISLPRGPGPKGGSHAKAGHHAATGSSLLRSTTARLLALAVLLLLLPLGFLLRGGGSPGSSSGSSSWVRGHTAARLAGDGSSSAPAGSGAASSSSDGTGNLAGAGTSDGSGSSGSAQPGGSSSSGSSNGEASSTSSDSSDARAAAGDAGGTAGQAGPDPAAAADGSGSRGDGFHCIPPSRALSWEEVDAEAQQAASNQAAAGQQLAEQAGRRQVLQAAAASDTAAAPAMPGSDWPADYYDYEAASAPAVPLSGTAANGRSHGAAAAVGSGELQPDGPPPSSAAAGVDDYYDYDAAPAAAPAAAGQPATSSSSSSSPRGPAPAASSVPAAVPAPAEPAISGNDGRSAAPSSGPEPAGGQPLAGDTGAGGIDTLEVALVNDVEFHHEVTLGLMAALQRHRGRLKVYLHDSVVRPAGRGGGDTSFGLADYMRSALPGVTLRDAYYKPGITRTDVAVFVSPEFSIDYYRDFIRRSTPRLVVVLIHEPDMELRRLQYIINMHPLVGVVALSPHVAERVRTRMRMHHVHWMMPVLPAVCDNSCWEGFAVQGKFEGSRRNYGELWAGMSRVLQQHLEQQGGDDAAAEVAAGEDVAGAPAATMALRRLRHVTHGASRNRAGSRALQQHRRSSSSTDNHGSSWLLTPALSRANTSLLGSVGRSSAARLVAAARGSGAVAGAPPPLPRINVLGSGQLALLSVPAALRPWVAVYRGLSYPDYYDTLCRSLALLPLFNASSGYLATKISSSVTASLATGTPLVVPRRFLEVYTMFKEEHVLLQEGPLLPLLALLSSPAASSDLEARRRSLARLRYVLSHTAAAKLDGLMAAALSRPHATTKQD